MTTDMTNEFMFIKFFPYKYRRLFVPCLILFIVIIIGHGMIQSFNNHFDNTYQSHIYVQQSTIKVNATNVQRAILIFYPSNQESHYLPEVQWLYRSWVEMMKYEEQSWRTDFIIYTGNYSSALQELGCVLNRIRQDLVEPPQCRIFLYLRLSYRLTNTSIQPQMTLVDQNIANLYEIDVKRSIVLYDELKTYPYIDSVNIIAEAYPTYKYYDFILKTDLDVFVTKQFAKYVPITNLTLLVGLGGYTTIFNTRRLGRIARDMNWKYKNFTNVGSTWYGVPYVAQRIANLTLDAMIHLVNYEFTRVERDQKVGTMLWPDWHYGVLSMYGTHLAVNHLLVSEELDIKKADTLLDQSTTNDDPDDLEKNNRLHLHCWHTEKEFSKFQFKAGKYSSIHPRTLLYNRSARAYAMRMALESRLMTLEELGQSLRDVGQNKTI